MRLKDYLYFDEDNEVECYPPIYFSKYHYEHYRGEYTNYTKILSASSVGMQISTLWQMQLLGWAHGIDIYHYESGYTDYEIETDSVIPDTLDEYFMELARLAAWYGCKTMELKCLTKALFWKCQIAKSVDELPQYELHSLYVRLSHAGYKRCGEWLLQYHFKKLRQLLDNQKYNEKELENYSIYAQNVQDYHTNYNVISEDLAEYLNKQILPQYAAFEKGHQEKHILQVAQRCETLVEENDLNSDINIDLLLTAAYFHDLGLSEGRETYQLASARMLREDGFVRDYFISEHIDIIAEAIEDHRASSKTAPRSRYGELLSAADKMIDHKEIIQRAYQHSEVLNPDFTQEEHIKAVYQYLVEKYGKNGNMKKPKFATKEDKYHLLELEYHLKDMYRIIEFYSQYITLN